MRDLEATAPTVAATAGLSVLKTEAPTTDSGIGKTRCLSVLEAETKTRSDSRTDNPLLAGTPAFGVRVSPLRACGCRPRPPRTT